MQNISIFKATLKLIHDGKFNLLSMAEIGYHARVSATTVEAIFETREELIHALGDYVFADISTIISISLRSKAPFEEKFFRLWDALLTHYRQNQGIIAFLDHYKNFPFSVDSVKALEADTTDLMARFFDAAERDLVTLGPETTARLFHENIRIAARLCTADNEPEMTAIAKVVFDGLFPNKLQELASLTAA